MASRLATALIAGAVLSGTPAHGADWYTGAPDKAGSIAPFGAAIDVSVAATNKGAGHLSLIGTVSPFTSMKESGIRIRLNGMTGSYDYVSSAPGVGKVTGRENAGGIAAGYEIRSGDTSFAVYGGIEFSRRTLSKADPLNTVVGNAIGFKTAVDFYTKPTSYTMASANFTYSTSNNSYYARLKGGIAMTNDIYVGPEVLFLGDNFYRQWRVGAHVSGVKMGKLQFGVSGGYVKDRRAGSGIYGILDSRLVF